MKFKINLLYFEKCMSQVARKSVFWFLKLTSAATDTTLNLKIYVQPANYIFDFQHGHQTIIAIFVEELPDLSLHCLHMA